MDRRWTPLLVAAAVALCGALAQAPAEAKSAKNKARDYCKKWEKDHPGEECGIVRGLVCTGKDWKKLKTFNALWTSCKQVRGQADRAKADERCAAYRKNLGQKCEVHYPGCRPGWVKLEKHGRYAACRPIQASGNLRYDAYKAFMRKWEGEAGTKMPRHMRRFLAMHYDFDPAKIRWGTVSNPHAGCTTDCYNIYCKRTTRVWERLTQWETFSELMFHELAHVEQCKKRGGRKKYALMWFGDLPAGFFTSLGNGVKDEFKNEVHDKMPMEKDAAWKAKKVLQQYLNGHYDKSWKCRLYRDDQIVWESENGYFRAQCDDPEHATFKKAAREFDRAKSKAGGTYRYVFGRRGKTHHVIWTKDVAPPRMAKPVPRRAPVGG